MLTDKKDEGYEFAVSKLEEICKKISLDLKEIGNLDFKAEDFKNYIIVPGIFAIYSSNNYWINKTVSSIRKNTEIALAPVLILSDTFKDELNLSDLVCKLSAENQTLISEIEKYLYIVNNANTYTYIAAGTDIIKEKLLILLRFLVIRNKKILEPKKTDSHFPYYSYPLASVLLDVKSGEEIDKLELLSKLKLLDGVLASKIFTCSSCQSANMTLRECCPKCSSADIQAINAISHKSCSYSAPEEDFVKIENSKLKCPKCNIEFSYNGNDCEKFEASLCNACGNIFKKPVINFNCLSCGKDMARDQVITRVINKYYITSDGVKAAESGILCNFSTRESVLKSDNNPIKIEIFKEILYLEIIRSIRSGTVFCLAEVEIKELSFSEIFLSEFSKILSKSLRVTDLYTRLEQGIFLILFLNCGVSKVNLALSKIKNEVKSVLKDQINIQWRIISKSGERSSDSLFENLAATHADGSVLKNELQQNKPVKVDLKKTIKKSETNKIIIKSISTKSIFKYFFFLYLIIFIIAVIFYTAFYYAGKKFGFVSPAFSISFLIGGIIDKVGLSFLNYFNNPVITNALACAAGLALSVVSGFLGFLLACLFNISLRMTGGIELRFSKNKPKD